MTQARLFFAALFFFVFALSEHKAAFGFQKTESEEQAAALTDANFPVWRDYIRVRQSELTWQDLPWVTSYYQGLLRAASENKPLLLWAMNGHPIGCT